MAARSTLADRLKLLRAEHGGSVQEVADAVGVSRSYLSGIENDHDKPGYESFVALADYYRVSLDWLAKGDPHPRAHLSPRGAQLLAHISALPESEQDRALVVIEALGGRLPTLEADNPGSRTGTGG